jgi:hypothetical protein
MKITLRCVAVTCLLLFSLSAFGDDDRRSRGFLMFNAGTLNVNIMQLQLSSFMLEPFSIIEERSRGTLGRANLKTFSTVISENGAPVVPDPEQCPDGFPIPIVITEDVTVLTFHDLSQLVGNVQTVVCIEPISGKQGVRGEGHWSSGTQRFAGVIGGEFKISSSATPQSANGQFYTTVGVISGRLER